MCGAWLCGCNYLSIAHHSNVSFLDRAHVFTIFLVLGAMSYDRSKFATYNTLPQVSKMAVRFPPTVMITMPRESAWSRAAHANDSYRSVPCALLLLAISYSPYTLTSIDYIVNSFNFISH